MNKLIAYMPVLNRQYMEWIQKHHQFYLYLMSGELMESLVPRLARNICAVPVQDICDLINLGPYRIRQNSASTILFKDSRLDYLGHNLGNCIMPDEDVSHIFAEKYLYPQGCKVEFESIWARWDMTAVKRQEPIIPDLEISSEAEDILCIAEAKKLARNSPDWWRQIGAMAFRGFEKIAVAYNQHYPTEYEISIFSDPRINFDAGDPTGAEIYLSLHAEKGIIAACARNGISLKGSSVYVTTFPCGDCARMLADCEIKELFFAEGYSVLKGYETLKAAGVRIVKVNT